MSLSNSRLLIFMVPSIRIFLFTQYHKCFNMNCIPTYWCVSVTRRMVLVFHFLTNNRVKILWGFCTKRELIKTKVIVIGWISPKLGSNEFSHKDLKVFFFQSKRVIYSIKSTLVSYIPVSHRLCARHLCACVCMWVASLYEKYKVYWLQQSKFSTGIHKKVTN